MLLEVLETQCQRVEERRADIAVKVKDSDREYVLHIEAVIDLFIISL